MGGLYSDGSPQGEGCSRCEGILACQATPLALHIQQPLDVPTASDAVERSFSKVGVLDTKQRRQAHPLLRKASVMLFCNGDVEGTFGYA